MKKVRILKATDRRKKGEVVEVDDQRAEQWVTDGIAALVKEKK